MSGFQNASVTKGMMISLGIGSLAVALLDIKPYIHLQLVPHISKYHQFWRLFTHPFIFTNSTEMLMGELLLYNIGVGIERSFGSRKYASFILISTVVSAFLSSAAIILFHAFGLNSIPAGPYGVIFSLIWQHYRTVPALYRFKLASIEFSSKIFIWILASQLVLSYPPTSIMASSIGLLTGYLYRTDLVLLPTLSLRSQRHLQLRTLKSYRISLSMHLLLSRIFGPLFGGAHPPRRANRTLPGQLSDAQLQASARASAIAATFGNGNESNALRRILARGLAPGPVPRAPFPNPVAPMTPVSTLNSPTNTLSPTDGIAIQPGLGGSGNESVQSGTTVGGARARMGEWVSEMTGSTGSAGRAPTEEEIGVLRSMFPNLSREVVVRALQRSDHNTAQAVEALLEESG